MYTTCGVYYVELEGVCVDNLFFLDLFSGGDFMSSYCSRALFVIGCYRKFPKNSDNVIRPFTCANKKVFPSENIYYIELISKQKSKQSRLSYL